MKLELKISWVKLDDNHRRKIQLEAMESSVRETDKHFEMYKKLSNEFGYPFYINTDLMLKTFPLYVKNAPYYEGCVRNSASVLTNAYYRKLLVDESVLPLNKIIFLAGVQGVGKSSMVRAISAANVIPDDMPIIYEGQMNFPMAKDKIDYALDNGFDVDLAVFHTTTEKAFNNTIKRFEAVGRGAPIEHMLNIQGNLYNSMSRIHKLYGDNVSFTLYDKRNMSDEFFIPPKILEGWEHLPILNSEGSYEEVREKLFRCLEKRCRKGNISENAVRQALGLQNTNDENGKKEFDWRKCFQENGVGHFLKNEEKFLFFAAGSEYGR